ncbi:Peroxisomal biogenesis factor-like protein [Paramyrothecium foliicola]|nr:Peroxisomal biogenesis factor-like protein [Paramyrothecium foliicola]
MPADRLLNTVLQYFQDVHDDAKTDQIIGTTTHLLTQLSNPLNLGVLTSQLLTAPAIWQRSDGLRTATRVLSIYNTAAVRVHEFATGTVAEKSQREGGGLRCDDWARAVVKGADERSSRWKHLLVLTGVLMGLEGNDKRGLSGSLRGTLEQAVVAAANLAMSDGQQQGSLARGSIVLALTFAMPLLSDFRKAEINCNALLPVATWAVTGPEGFSDGQFVAAISRDIQKTPENVLMWSAQSPSYRQLQHMESLTLVSNMGPVSKLVAFAVQSATDTRAVLNCQDAILAFTNSVMNAWSATHFSGLDPADEAGQLHFETKQTTWPFLWQTLRKMMFAAVVMLQAVVSRALLDPNMFNDATAPRVATKTLQILRNLFFVSSRNGNNAFQAYDFTYLASLDVLSRNSLASERFLQEARDLGIAAQRPHMQRTLDLFYLNVAEHLPLALSTDACDALIIKPATAYLAHDGPMSPSMIELFESAHSAVLSVLSCPQHSPLTIRMAPFYIIKLFQSFPRLISPRQFRIAFKTVMQIVSPPFPIAAIEPHLSETLLEMLCTQLSNAATAPLPPSPHTASNGVAADELQEMLSEQSSLAMALVDSLPYLPLPLVEEWFTIAAQQLNKIEDPVLKEPVKRRFLDILVNGDLDVERAAIGVAWWGTKGGRELVLSGGVAEPIVMSGAIMNEEPMMLCVFIGANKSVGFTGSVHVSGLIVTLLGLACVNRNVMALIFIGNREPEYRLSFVLDLKTALSNQIRFSRSPHQQNVISTEDSRAVARSGTFIHELGIWPWNCHALYVWSQGDELETVYEHFNITEQQLLDWNCFLGQDDLKVKPDEKLCVEATMEFFRNKAQHDGSTKHRQSSSTTHMRSTATSPTWSGVLDFTTYAIFFSSPKPTTEETPTVRYWTTYPKSDASASTRRDRTTEAESTETHQTAYASSSIASTKGNPTGSTAISPTRRRTRSTNAHTQWITQTTTYTPDLSPSHVGACAYSTAAAPSASAALPNMMRRPGIVERRINPNTLHDSWTDMGRAKAPHESINSSTDKCDAGHEGAEDCRITLQCDKSLQQYPTCVEGACICAAISCSKEEACEMLHQCRDDDEHPKCMPEPYAFPDVEGICECTARSTGCLYAEEPRDFCHGEVRCTEKGFSAYPEFPRCVSADAGLTYPRGRCDCQPVFCRTGGERLEGEGEGDGEGACADLVVCGGGAKPRCASMEGGDGYCTCEA